MELYLKKTVFAAICGRDLITLDIAEGRYDLFAGAAVTAKLDASGRRITLDDETVGQAFADLIVHRSQFEITPNLPPLPSQSALEDEILPTLTERLTFSTAWLDVAFTYYGRGLPNLLDGVRRNARASRKARDVERLSRAFHQLSPWAPFAGDCVFRCYMLLRALRREGVEDVAWVFGVRTWPFYAHCWLQRGEVTLSDYAEPLASFTPIFAV